MLWRRNNALAEEAYSRASLAQQAIGQHIVDCQRRYEELRKVFDERHKENGERLDRLERVIQRMIWALLSGLGVLVALFIEIFLRNVKFDGP